MLRTMREHGITSAEYPHLLDNHTVIGVLAFGEQAIDCHDLGLLIEVNKILREYKDSSNANT